MNTQLQNKTGLFLAPVDAVPGCPVSKYSPIYPFNFISCWLLPTWFIPGFCWAQERQLQHLACPMIWTQGNVTRKRRFKIFFLFVYGMWETGCSKGKGQKVFGDTETPIQSWQAGKIGKTSCQPPKLFSQIPLQRGVATEWNLSDRMWAEVICVTSRTKPVKKQLEPPPPGPPPPPSECREQASETNVTHVWQKEFCPLIVIWREWERSGTPILDYVWLKLYLYCIWANIPLGVCLFQWLSSCPACYTNKPNSERRHQGSHAFLTSFAWLTHPHELSQEGLRWFSLEPLSRRLP